MSVKCPPRRIAPPAEPLVDLVGDAIELLLALALGIGEEIQLPLAFAQPFGRHADQPHRLEGPLLE